MATTFFFLLRRAYTRADFEHMLSQVPFRYTEIHQEAIGLEVWFTK